MSVLQSFNNLMNDSAVCMMATSIVEHGINRSWPKIRKSLQDGGEQTVQPFRQLSRGEEKHANHSPNQSGTPLKLLFSTFYPIQALLSRCFDCHC